MFACGPESRQCACTSCPGKVGSLRQSSSHSCRTSEWPVVSLNIRTSALRGLAAASCVFVLQPPEYDATGYPCTSPIWSTYSAMLPRRASSQSLNHSCRSHSSGSRDNQVSGSRAKQHGSSMVHLHFPGTRVRCHWIVGELPPLVHS